MVNYSFNVGELEYFLLILVRVSSFIFIAPFYGRREVAGRVKIGLSVFLSILIFFTIPLEEAEYASEIGYAILVLKEGITGLLIGFAANICNSIILYAGTIIDMDIGISMSTIFDPATGSEVALTGNMYNYFLLLLLITSNMYQYILRAFVDSFRLIPLGGAIFEMDALFQSISMYMADLFIIAFRIVLPVFACIMILNAVLGIMAKVAPQMNMFAVGIQLKLLVGLAVLFITVFMLPDIANFIFKEMRNLMIDVIRGMY